MPSIKITALCIALCAVAAQARPQQDRFAYDEILCRENDRSATLGSTGRRLFANRIETHLGFQGEFGYCCITPEFTDPMLLTFLDENEMEIAVESRGVTWYPSHLQTHWHAKGLEIREWKFITDDDMLVDRVSVANTSDEPVDLKLIIQSPQAPMLERLGSRQIPVDLSPWADTRLDGVSQPRGSTIHFSLPRSGSGPAFLQLKEGAAFDVPDIGRNVAHLNVLLTGTAELQFTFDDSTVERLGKSRRVHWRRLNDFLVLLTYTPPPGRFIRKCTALKGEGPEIPVLLAATFEIPPRTGRLPVLVGQPDFHGLPVHLALAGDGFGLDSTRRLIRSIHLESGATAAFNAVMASGPKLFPAILMAQERSRDGEVLDHHIKIYRKWFDENVPTFSCSDPLMEKGWHHRWFLARYNMVRLDLPVFSLPVFYADLHGDASVTTLSTPFILTEVRWLKDRRFAQGQIRTLLMQQYENGLLPNVRPGERGGFFIHWIPAAAIGAYQVNGSRQYLEEVLPLLARNVEGTLRVFDEDGDHLPEIRDEVHTGSSGQPSFAWFEPGVPLERVEFASYLHASALAVSEGYRVVENRDEAERFEALARKIQDAVLEKMWHQEDGFFYSLRASDDAPARCREGAGYAPFFTRLATDDLLADLPSHANSMNIVATANVLRYHDPSPRTAEHFRSLLDAFTRSQEGERLFHSTYNDLLIRFVGGLTPRMDGKIELHPLVKDLDYFRFQGIPYHGRTIDLFWDGEGYSVHVDGERVALDQELRPMKLN